MYMVKTNVPVQSRSRPLDWCYRLHQSEVSRLRGNGSTSQQGFWHLFLPVWASQHGWRGHLSETGIPYWHQKDDDEGRSLPARDDDHQNWERQMLETGI